MVVFAQTEMSHIIMLTTNKENKKHAINNFDLFTGLEMQNGNGTLPLYAGVVNRTVRTLMYTSAFC